MTGQRRSHAISQQVDQGRENWDWEFGQGIGIANRTGNWDSLGSA